MKEVQITSVKELHRILLISFFFFANWNTQESKMIITTYICEVVRVKDIILTIYLTFS